MEDKVALVTGAAGGVGAAICQALREAGARVALTDANESALHEASSALGEGDDFATFVADLGDDELTAGLPAVVRDRFGSIDILVNNAGVRQVAPMLELSPAEWRRTPDIDLVAPFTLSRAAIPLMTERGGGNIVNISSMAGLSIFRDRAAYSAAKAGLIMLTKDIVVEFGDQGSAATP